MSEKPYDDIPGTTIFDGEMARQGYWANQCCNSLTTPANRERFLSDERVYLDEWPMTEDQKQAIVDRNYNALLKLGGNVYFFSKLFFTDEKSFEECAAAMAGMPQKDYRAMMISGGRSIEGNRYTEEGGG